jgi:hypothetical protein
MMLWSTETNDGHLLLGHHGFVGDFNNNGNMGMLIRHNGHYFHW